jgi:hypothetical protein
MIAAFSIPASAGTMLQIQFQRWAYVNSTTVQVLVTLRNATMKSFARVVWDCDLFDKDHRLVGRSPFVFTVVPWGAIVVDSQYVYANGGMFETGSCTLSYAEEKTFENERLYRASPKQANIGNGDPLSRQWFSFDSSIQGKASVITEAEEAKLEAEHR